MTSGRFLVMAVVLAAALTLAGCGLRADPLPRAGAEVFSIGECVTIPSSAPDTLHAVKSACSQDPSYTVGATTDASGQCPSIEYQRLARQSVDTATARLCLVPNLVADHCYVLDVPIGVVQRADCTERDQQGLLVQITQRLDVRDQQACPSDVGHYAWPYPSPPRTYCTLTVY